MKKTILFLLMGMFLVSAVASAEDANSSITVNVSASDETFDPFDNWHDTWFDWVHDFRHMRGQLNRFMQDFDASRANMPQYDFAPGMDIIQKENQLIVSMDLPGVRKEDIDIEIQEGVLSVSGIRENKWANKGAPNQYFYRGGRRFGKYFRSFQLPEGVDPNQVKASYEAGVLEVTLSLKEKAETQPVKVKVS